MLSVEQALEKILPAFRLLPAEVIPLENALGRVLAEDVRAENDMPPFANSSMDGYAIRAADIAPSERNAPIRLTVIGDIPAGIAPTFVVGQGEAARIMTGAMMPYGADTVVPVENTDDPGFRTGNTQLPAHITIQRISDTGAYVRLPGEDVRRGDVVLRSGRVLRVADLGVLAGLGVPRVSVIGRPVVAILSTGDELLTASDPLQPGKIRDSNSYTVAAMVESLGSTPLRLGIARDTVEDVQSKLQQAIDSGADLIISTAGVSVGAFDVVKTVIESLGALNFWKVNLRPGKPLAYGHVSGVPLIGLPGNPVSAIVTFDVFVRPAILTMTGRALDTDIAEAEIAHPMTSDGRRTYARVQLSREGGRLLASSTGSQESNILTSLVAADGLLIIPEGMKDIPAGTRLPVRLLG